MNYHRPFKAGCLAFAPVRVFLCLWTAPPRLELIGIHIYKNCWLCPLPFITHISSFLPEMSPVRPSSSPRPPEQLSAARLFLERLPPRSFSTCQPLFLPSAKPNLPRPPKEVPSLLIEDLPPHSSFSWFPFSATYSLPREPSVAKLF